MARVRTFIAVDLAAGVRDRLIAVQDKLGGSSAGVKWVAGPNMHLTLLFLGEVGELEVVDICRVVQGRAGRHEPFTLEVAGLGAFPNERRPKILWAGIADGAKPLKALHAELEDGLLELGCYRREDREYTPHLTLGRLTHDERTADWGAALAKNKDWHGGISPVDEVLVMASELRRDGPRYSVMGRAPLGQRVSGGHL
ncbi:MAG TPA: RNA 2',3'-cyclic phosphodiesterase [Gemmataceae bacterium]|nr:RNA 2',3'-cyclic phosphodiesterase [Gemmataceae bacterium]